MKKIIIIALSIAAICMAGCGSKTVGKTIKESDFEEFYYTYSTTVNPPEFQRYRIYKDNGKNMFYHEKREGVNVFLTEEDITVSGEMELSPEEWEKFWDLLSGGTVRNRREDARAGGGGPWLYLYWKGDKDKCQEYTFSNLEKKTEFEEFCVELKSR